MGNSKTYLRIGSNKEVVSTFEIDDVEISYSIKDIHNFGQRNSNFTKTISVLKTKESENVFKGLSNINCSGCYDIGKKVYGEIVKNGIILLSGNIQVINITPEKYEVVLANDNLYLFDVLGDKYIARNLNPSDNIVFTGDSLYTHMMDPSVIRNYMISGPSDNGYGIFYPIIDYNDGISSVSDIENNYPLVPALAITQIFEKIISDAGFTYEVTNDISTLMKQLYIPINNDVSLRSDYTFARYKFHDTHIDGVGGYTLLYKSASLTYPSFSAPYWSRRSSWTETYDYFKYPPSFYDEVGLELPYGEIVADVSLRFDCLTDEHESSTTDCFLKKYNYDGTIDSIELGSLTVEEASIGVYYLNKTMAFNNYERSNLWLSLVPDAIKSTVVVGGKEMIYGFLQLNRNESHIEFTIKNSLYNKRTVTINDLLPTYKQKDFISDILKMTNSFITSDATNHLQIKSYNNYYQPLSEAVDWTSKVNSNSIKMIPSKNEVAKTTKLSYTSDNNKYAEDFKTKYDDTFATKTIINDSEFVKDDNQIILSCAPTVMKKISDIYEFPVVEDPSIKCVPSQGYLKYRWYDHFDPGDTILGVHRENYYEGLITGTRTFDVICNTYWRFTYRPHYKNGPNPPFVSCTPASGFGDTTVTLYLEPNPYKYNRDCSIGFSLDTYPYINPLSLTIVPSTKMQVEQEAKLIS